MEEQMEKFDNPNSFDVKNNFFCIDSDGLDDVQTELYGFAIINEQFIDSAESLENSFAPLSRSNTCIEATNLTLDGNGGYVYIRRESDKIRIMQDFIGSYGVYLYRDGDYFALSNSFLYLVEHIEKTAHKISINRDYANFFIVAGLCSVAYSETMISEIETLDRSAVVEIDIMKKNLEIHYLDYGENTIELNSKEGTALLDNWYNRWTSYIRNLKSQDANIQVDLSGGIDSRLTLLLMLGAGIDLNEIYVHSIEDKLHTHQEDFEIAEDISKFYHFSLNNTSNLHHQSKNYTMEDILNISFYTKLTFHKQMYFKNNFLLPERHYFGGSGGECIRNYWNMSESEYIEQMIRRCRPFSISNSTRFANSVQTLLERAFENIKRKFDNLGRSIKEQDMTLNLYRETRCRNHFGKDIVENYFSGVIKYCPLLDPQLHKLKLNDVNCKDKNLLIAVIFDRYQKKLLDFKFEGKRSIDTHTLNYAEMINRTFPRIPDKNSEANISYSSNHTTVMKVNAFSNAVRISQVEIAKYIENIFYSKRLKGIFLSLYDEEVYDWIAHDMRTKKYQPLENAYVAIAICTILQSVYANETIGKGALSTFTNMRNIDRTIKQTLKKRPYLDNYITARIDIKNSSIISMSDDYTNDIEIIEITDQDAKVNTPNWFAANGKGYVIESQSGNMTIIFKCIHSGKLFITLRGRDVRDKEGKKIPFWIDYHSMTYNNEQIFNTLKPVWHDAPFSLNRLVKNGEIVMIHMEWGPHNW